MGTVDVKTRKSFPRKLKIIDHWKFLEISTFNISNDKCFFSFFLFKFVFPSILILNFAFYLSFYFFIVFDRSNSVMISKIRLAEPPATL